MKIEDIKTGGMTLRDYYAAKALQGLCANPGGPFQANGMNGWSMTNCSEADIAGLCHDLADAMLVSRQNANGDSSAVAD